jgi:hypothetical protein
MGMDSINKDSLLDAQIGRCLGKRHSGHKPA